ncbi:MAG: 50S ribosomal protein L22 [Candidatus Marinimicrobia bacterium]|nr:50S ribosomal protein L22 [Candidatus Neomarinimicrobiota bacterium]
MEARAIQRNIRQSARKVRQVCDMIRGKKLEFALNTLHFSNKKASLQIEKTLRSAVSNLLNTDEGGHLEPEDLFIKSIFVNEGPTARRFRPTAMGRATIIRKRTSHLTVVVAEKDDKKNN